MSVAEFTVGTSGTAGANGEYITRSGATEKIDFFNLDHLQSDDLRESRTNAVAYAYSREEIELARAPEGCTYYKLILSWDRKESNEKVAEESLKFLENHLPDTKAIIGVHQNTDNTHAHIHIDAREKSGKKIHLNMREIERISDGWTEQYDETYGTNYAPEYKAKKAEKKAAKERARKGEGIAPVESESANKFDHSYWQNKQLEETFGVRLDKPEIETETSSGRVKREFAKSPIVKNEIEVVLADAVTKKPPSAEFITKLRERQVFFKPNVRPSGKVAGASFVKTDENGEINVFKGSELEGDYKWSSLENKIDYDPKRDAQVFAEAKREAGAAVRGKNNSASDEKIVLVEKAAIETPPAIQEQVERYMLDLKQMMNARRESLLGAVMQASYSSLIKKGLPTDWNTLKSFAVASIDLVSEREGYLVREKITNELQHGTHVGEQISLKNQSSIDAVHSILKIAAENSHPEIVQHTLTNYEEHITAQTREFSAPGINLQIKGVNQNEESGLRTNQSLIEAGGRSAQNPERTAPGAGSGIELPAQSEGQRTEPGEERKRTPENASRTDGGIFTDSQTDIRQSGTGELCHSSGENEQFAGTLLRGQGNSSFGASPDEFNYQEDFDEQFYQRGFTGVRAVENSDLGSISKQFEGIEIPQPAEITSFEIPPLEIYQPQIAPNNDAFVKDILEMMKASLDEQNKQLSLRAEKIYETQLKAAANVPPTQIQFDYVKKFNENKSEDERISIEGKSKLEATHEIISSLDDKERNNALVAQAATLEKQVKAERMEVLQEEIENVRGLTM